MKYFTNIFIIAYSIYLFTAFCHCQRNFSTRASYYKTQDEMGNPSGACGYGEDGRSANNGEVCAVSRRLFKNGAGCGACYHVRCKSKGLCSQEGENVMVTDYAEGHDDVDFVVSYHTFERLARLPRMTDILTSKGFVDVEYQRVSCGGGAARNLTVKVHENSQYPHYLSLIVPTNQGGASDILAIEVYERDSLPFFVPPHKSTKWMGRTHYSYYKQHCPHLIFQAHLPPQFWVEALNMTAQIFNLFPTTTLHNKTPHAVLYNNSPSYSHLRVFGFLCYPNLSATAPYKLAPISSRCIFLGYPINQHGFCCLDITTNKIIISNPALQEFIWSATEICYGHISVADLQRICNGKIISGKGTLLRRKYTFRSRSATESATDVIPSQIIK